MRKWRLIDYSGSTPLGMRRRSRRTLTEMIEGPLGRMGNRMYRGEFGVPNSRSYARMVRRGNGPKGTVIQR
jgi:hypothetical protein